jgi:AcrR family transcriptional regulator
MNDVATRGFLPGADRSAPTAHNAIDSERILDGAFALVREVGPSRITMSDLARHVGVSRATLYRRWPNLETLISEMIQSRWRRLADAAFGVLSESRSSLDNLVEGIVMVTGAIRHHPLMVALIEHDPAFLHPFIFERRAPSLTTFIDTLKFVIEIAPDDGTVSRTDPQVLSEAVVAVAIMHSCFAPMVFEDAAIVEARLRWTIRRLLAATSGHDSLVA